MTEIDEEVLDRLEAEAKVADADVEELTIAVESDLEQKDSEVEELQEEVETKEAEIEQLSSKVEEKEQEVEEMSEKVESVKDDYAEELAKNSEFMDKEDFLNKFDFEELQEKYDSIESSSDPAPNSGDPGAGFQNGNGEDPDGGDNEEAELSETEELAAASFRERAQKTGKNYWNEIADEIEEAE
jgi:cell division protein FtsB